MGRRPRAPLLAAMLVCAAICTEKGGPVDLRLPPATGERPVTGEHVPASINIPGTANRTLAFGDTVRLRAIVRDSHGNVIEGAPVVWASRDSAVAGVQDGLVTPRTLGTVRI